MTAPDDDTDVQHTGSTAPAAAPVARAGGEETGGTSGHDAAQETGHEERRLHLFAYLQAREHRTYLTIMRLFTSTLLADLSAGEVAGALAVAEREGRVEAGESDIDTVIDRLKQLTRWGNLEIGRRETIAASITEFQHGSARYQVSKLAVRVQRDVDALLRVPEGAREVSRELLPAVEHGLAEISELVAQVRAEEPERDGTRLRNRLSEQVTTVFLQHAELAATVRDFYAYLGRVVTRHDLAPEEIAGFRDLLVDYIRLVVDDVLRHTDAIAETLTALSAHRPRLLGMLSSTDSLGGEVERARGRTEADWQELTDWFVDAPGRPSQVSALREATARAIGSLLSNVKRVTSGAGPVPGRRGELLKLARWFDESGTEDAHRLYAAAFGLYSARNLLPAPDHDSDNHEVAFSDGPVLDVPVSVRTRGDRGARGRASRVLHDPMTEEALLSEAREQNRHREAAVAELSAVGSRLQQAGLSPEALEVLCELLTTAMAQREHDDEPGTAHDPVHGLRVTVRPRTGVHTRIGTSTGTLTLSDTELELGPAEEPIAAETAAAAGVEGALG